MRRVATVIGTAAVVMLATSVFAQTPNFAGKWTRDAEKTAAAIPAGGDMTITQDAKTLVISRMVGDTSITTTYNLDGSPSKNIGMGRGGRASVETTSTAKWDGAKLVITADNGSSITYSRDGAWLLASTTRPGRDGGPATTTAVYYKKTM